MDQQADSALKLAQQRIAHLEVTVKHLVTAVQNLESRLSAVENEKLGR